MFLMALARCLHNYADSPSPPSTNVLSYKANNFRAASAKKFRELLEEIMAKCKYAIFWVCNFLLCQSRKETIKKN